jgi:hypothetical protein
MKHKEPIFTYDSHELVMKNKKSSNLIKSIVSLILAILIFQLPQYIDPIAFQKNLIAHVIACIILVVIGIHFALKYFNRQIQVVINKSGIWTNKNGFLAWQDVWYYYTKVITGEGLGDSELCLKLKNTDLLIKIGLANYDKSTERIMNSFEYYAEKFSITNLGVEEVRV